MRVILTGGLGYIGSHTCIELLNNGIVPTIIDNLSNSTTQVLDQIKYITGKVPVFFEADLKDQEQINKIFSKTQPSAVIHFAALKDVAESFDKIDEYYSVNIQGLLNLLSACSKFDVKSFVFSSSAAVYGIPETIPVTEESRTNPISPYGKTKLLGEEIIRNYCQTLGSFQSVLLRYFNPVGAHPSGYIGESPLNAPSNLMPLICNAAKNKSPIKIYGNSYPTKDGTGVRDYIHVSDLATAHFKALNFLAKPQAPATIFNIGTGTGYSVQEMINCFEAVNTLAIRQEFVSHREGDAPECFADNKKALSNLGWKPQFSLEEMCLHSWNWAKKIN
mgnify:CR=1 FL=1